jgi:Toxin with a conserved tryptophan and TIP tripeptide motif
VDRVSILKIIADFKADPANAGKTLGELIADCPKKAYRRLKNYIKMTCKELLDKINEFATARRAKAGEGTKGLADRYAEQIAGKSPPGSKSYINHMIQYYNQQKQLQEMIDAYENEHPDDCNDSNGPPPAPAMEWAVKPHPADAQYVGPPPSAFTAKNAAIVGGSIGLGYIVYRVIRLLPSLFVPPTIPLNLAIP